MGKRGQIYIVAAIILIAFIAGIVTISNSFSKIETQNIEDESTQLSYEIQKIFDASSDDSERLTNLIKFADSYESTSTVPIDFYFILGDDNNIDYTIYDSSNKSVNFEPLSPTVATALVDVTPRGILIKDQAVFSEDDQSWIIPIETDDGTILKVPVGDNNFHYVISKDVKGEKHILIK